MIREFAQLLSEAVDEGFNRGVNEMFLEALEMDYRKNSILAEHGVPTIIRTLFEDAGIEVSDDDVEELDLENMSEEEIDALTAQLQDELGDEF